MVVKATYSSLTGQASEFALIYSFLNQKRPAHCTVRKGFRTGFPF